MFRIESIIIQLILSLIWLAEASAGTRDIPSKKPLYLMIGKFYGYKESVSVEKEVVKCYDVMDWGKEDTLSTPVDWKGEKYQVRLFRWEDSSFVFERRYYTNERGRREINWGDYDTSMVRNLGVPEAFRKDKQLYIYTIMRLVNTYAEGDLNSDGKKDLVIVLGDTTRTKLPYIDYVLEIYEQEADDKYSRKFSYGFSDIEVGKVTIQDANGDKEPDVILWTRSRGASGWSETARIFSRIEIDNLLRGR